MKIKIVLTKYSYVLLDNQKVKFATKKARALFYYILINKESSRDVLAYMFWPNSNLGVGKKNLRNTLHYIKKSFYDTDIFEKNNNTICLRSDIELTIENDISSGDILKDLYIKNCEDFNSFLDEYINTFEVLTYENNKSTFIKTIPKTSEKEALISFQNLKNQNPFDEDIYKVIMIYLQVRGKYSKVIRIYKKLEELLETELSVKPNKEIEKIYEASISLMKYKSKSSKDYFYGRSNEINIMNLNYINFLKNENYCYNIVCAHTGVGKTVLLSKFMNDVKNLSDINTNKDNYCKSNLVINMNCYEAESNFSFMVINSIISKIIEKLNKENIALEDNHEESLTYLIKYISNSFHDINEDKDFNDKFLDLYTFTKSITMLIDFACNKFKIVICIDNMQYMDKMSSSFISHYLSNYKGNNIFLIGSIRAEYKKDFEQLYFDLEVKNKLNIINLDNFTKDDVVNIVKDLDINGFILDNEEMSKFKEKDMKKIDFIYSETNGNPLFLFEYLRAMKENKDINDSKFMILLKNKIHKLEITDKKVLYISSLFFGNINYNAIANILQISSLNVLEIMDVLESYGFIKEYIEDDGIHLSFIHERFRKYIYEDQSKLKRDELHNQIANYLSQNCCKLTHTKCYCDDILYHYKCSDNKTKYLEQKIKKLSFLIDVNIEFPEFLTKIATQNIKDIEEELKTTDIDNNIKHEFYLIRGSFEIKTCNYVSGIDYIRRIINIDNNYNRLIKAYKQMIYYGIQVRNTSIMNENISNALLLMQKNKVEDEKAEILKFYGLLCIMNGDYEKGDKLLDKSYEYFRAKEINKHNLYNLACVYNYKAYIHKYKKEYSKSIEYYLKAIKICEDNDIINGLTVFYTNMGQSLYKFKKFENSKKYFIKADNLYKKIDTMWSRALTEGYLGFIYFDEKKYSESKEHIVLALKFSSKLRNLYESTYVYKGICKIRKAMNMNDEINKIYGDVLNKDYQYYYDKAVNGFKVMNLLFEIDDI